MLKPDKIREVITKANPYLKRDPDKLHVFLDSGRVVAYGAASLSYEYQYTINIVVLDYPHHADQIFVPLLAYLRTQQPELFENHEMAQNMIRFEAEILNQQSVDLSIEVDLTESVIVSQPAGNKLVVEHVGEPEHPDFPESDVQVEVHDHGTGSVIGTYTVPAWSPEF